MLTTQFKTALRSFYRNKSFTTLNVVGLAIGFTSCLLLLLYVDFEWSFDKQFSDHRNIYIVYSNQHGSGKINSFAVSPAQLAGAALQEIPGVTGAVRVSDAQEQLIAFNNQPFKKSGMYVDSSFFELFDYPFVEGNARTALRGNHAIVLTQKMAKTLFGSQEPLNKILRINDHDDLIVTGILKDIPANETNQFDFIMPWALNLQNNPSLSNAGWGANVCQTYIRLGDQQAFATADGLFRKMLKEHDGPQNNTEAFLYPFSRYHLYDKFENGKPAGGRIEQVRLLAILAFGILLIACINYMNLSTARSQTRAKEIGIRKTLGSSRSALMGHFLQESLLYSICASLLAVLLLDISLPYFNQWLGLSLASPFERPLFWMTLLLLTIVTGLVSGSYPSFYLSGFQPLKVLKGITVTGTGALRFRQTLVVVQFVLAICLIVATAVIYQQISYIRSRPIGFDKNNLVEIPLEGPLGTKTALLKNQLYQDGIALSACNLSQSLTNIYFSGYITDWPGKQGEVLFNYYGVGYDFSKTTGLSITQGRDFSRDYSSDTTAVLLSESAVSAMHLKQPVGVRIKCYDQQLTVVGVFRDFVSGSPYRDQRPMMAYLNNTGGNVLAIKLDPGKDLGTAVEALNTLLKRLNPAYPPDIHFVDQAFEAKFQNEKQLGAISNLFGALAVFISCLGLFGLSAFAAEQRIKEIGIRKILGASSTGIIRLLSFQYIKLVLLAALIAFPLAWLVMHQWLAGYEYRVGLSGWVFLAAGMLTLLIALFTVSFLSLKAAIASPVKNLRTE